MKTISIDDVKKWHCALYKKQKVDFLDFLFCGIDILIVNFNQYIISDEKLFYTRADLFKLV